MNKNHLKIAIILFFFVSNFCLAEKVDLFSIDKQCLEDKCSLIRALNSKREEIAIFDRHRVSDISRLGNNVYYFHVSCGGLCGYGNYVTRKNIFVIEDEEIIFDEKRECVVYADSEKRQIFYRLLKNNYSKKVYDFYIFESDDYYQELLSMEPLHKILEKDAFIDENNELHLYLFGKNSKLLNINIKNICED